MRTVKEAHHNYIVLEVRRKEERRKEGRAKSQRKREKNESWNKRERERERDRDEGVLDSFERLHRKPPPY